MGGRRSLADVPMTRTPLIQCRALPLVVTSAALICLYPLVPSGGAASIVPILVMVLFVVSGVLMLRGTLRRLLVSVSMGFFAVVANVATATWASAEGAELTGAAASVPFFAILSWHALQYAMYGAAETNDRLLAACASYLQLGLLWSGVHAAIEIALPGAYVAAHSDSIRWQELIYFSYTTLTTLGYGDIAPRVPLAQAASCFEAVTGVCFLAFVVARVLIPARESALPDEAATEA